ncbi:MAG: AMP-binding protein [Myxococcales bacterium]|nr:AMP-binding protein [Myxococcales bacterium]
MSPPSIPAVFREQVLKLQARPMAYGKLDGHWRPLTWAQMGVRVAHAAAGLVALGLEVGERVAIWARNSPEWVLADLATASAGGVDAPIADSSTPEYVRFVLGDAGARVLVIDGAEQLKVVARMTDRPAGLSHVDHGGRGGAAAGDRGADRAQPARARGPGRGARRRRGRRAGGRAAPRRSADAHLHLGHHRRVEGRDGVARQHDRQLHRRGARALPIKADDHLLSFLPLSQSFERMAGYYMASLFGGATLHYVQSMGRLIHDMGLVRPTLMTGVPRVYEKIYHRFLATLEAAPPLRRRLLEEALTVGREVARLKQHGERPGRILGAKYRLAFDQVFAPLAARMGGRVRFFVSGGAPLAPEVAEFFLAAGLLILEGYGLSEASPVVSVNRPGAYRFGTVGRPLDNVRVRIGDDGEILVHGPNVMQGYFGRPDETAEVLQDGWLATGDVGSSTATASCVSPIARRTCSRPRRAGTSRRRCWSGG